MMTSLPSDLPRLLYIGDVPVEASSHGSALLYRLLQGYLPEKLMVIEGNLQKPTPERRLPRVQYRLLNLGWERPLNSRFNRYWSPWLTCMARFKNPAVENLVQDFAPDAVLTVHHGYSWITAARFAERRGLPMHLILHDDWNRLAPLQNYAVPGWIVNLARFTVRPPAGCAFHLIWQRHMNSVMGQKAPFSIHHATAMSPVLKDHPNGSGINR